jgi:hypothetical protein
MMSISPLVGDPGAIALFRQPAEATATLATHPGVWGKDVLPLRANTKDNCSQKEGCGGVNMEKYVTL